MKNRTIDAIVKIAVALITGALMVWVVRYEWAMVVVATALKVLIMLAALFVAYSVHQLLGDDTVPWARITASIILAFAVAVTLMELTSSHKMVRIIQQSSENGDDDE